MEINMYALKALELKLAEYSKENGTIAEHESANMNSCACNGKSCTGECFGSCKTVCWGGPTNRIKH